MKKQSHLTRAIFWFKLNVSTARTKYNWKSWPIYEFNMWIELFEAAEEGEI